MRQTLVAAVLLVLLLAAPGAAEPAPCTCPEQGGCYHWLGAPVSPVDEPCPCPRCRAAKGSCPRVLPKGWDSVCANN